MPSSTVLDPPWSQFPSIPWVSAGWRMGHGEVYWHKWHSWWNQLLPEDKLAYQSHWPEVQGWEGFYAWATTGETPPWMEDERRKTATAALPPQPGETTITERYRVKWLATNYFRKPKVLVRDPYEKESYQLMADPDGWLWKLRYPISTQTEFKAPHFTRQVTEVIGNDNLPVKQPVA
jgi:hypothetical protein